MIQQQYTVIGMTCNGCKATVTNLLSQLPNVISVNVSLEEKLATISATVPLQIGTIQKALQAKPKFTITAASNSTQSQPLSAQSDTVSKSWVATYKPLLIIFAFITGISFIASKFSIMAFMNNFMAGFFIVFSFFKLLDVAAFANTYKMYDVVAAKFPLWGKIYPFVELALGIAYLIRFNPKVTNWATLDIMLISIIGVIKSVTNKKKIQCACLGNVFNLPMSTVTIIEDGLMILMAGIMLILMYN
jgi:copper chaperone CopZ